MEGKVTNRFVGKHVCRLDDKNRVPVPAPYRRLIEAEGDRDLFLFPGLDPCIYVYTGSGWDRFVDRKLQDQAMGSEDERDVSRLLSTSTELVTIDKAGRILLPEGIRGQLEIPARAQVAFVGVTDRMEIWHLPAWEVWHSTKSKHYSVLAERYVGRRESKRDSKHGNGTWSSI